MYIDSANLLEISELNQLGIFKGVTTNPTLLLQEKTERITQLNQLLALDIDQLFVQLEGTTVEELYADFLMLAEKLSDPSKVAYKVAVNQEGLLAIKEIKSYNPEVELLGTAIYSAEQIFLAALAGCASVAPYVNRMQVQGIEPNKVISSAKQFMINQKYPCQIMGASFKNSQQVKDVYDAGIDTVTLPKEVIMQMLNRELANQAIEVFNQHGQELKNNYTIPRFNYT